MPVIRLHTECRGMCRGYVMIHFLPPKHENVVRCCLFFTSSHVRALTTECGNFSENVRKKPCQAAVSCWLFRCSTLHYHHKFYLYYTSHNPCNPFTIQATLTWNYQLLSPRYHYLFQLGQLLFPTRAQVSLKSNRLANSSLCRYHQRRVSPLL